MKMKRKYAIGMPRRRADVYNKWPSIHINFEKPVPQDAAARADSAFALIKPHLGGTKLREKQKDWRPIHYALERAGKRAAVVFHRNRNHPNFRSIRLQLMSAAIAAGLVEEERSPKGSPKSSRIIPIKIKAPKSFIELRDRETKQPLPINWQHPVASAIRTKLEIINRTNEGWVITIRPWDFWNEELLDRKRIRPVHRAIFTESFDLHGRIYGTHQKHGKEARQTVRFGNTPAVELDYEGFHARALYHQQGIVYEDDPYLLWGKTTSPEMRLMAKQLINTAINAVSRDATIRACNNAMNRRASHARWKEGKKLETAIRLHTAALQTGLKFADIYDLAVERHRRIAKYFGSDEGIKLMRRDSEIALAILFHFTSQGYPCLSIHDSFIVPAGQEDELRRVMIAFYRREFEFDPIVKR